MIMSISCLVNSSRLSLAHLQISLFIQSTLCSSHSCHDLSLRLRCRINVFSYKVHYVQNTRAGRADCLDIFTRFFLRPCKIFFFFFFFTPPPPPPPPTPPPPPPPTPPPPPPPVFFFFFFFRFGLQRTT
uniref:Uncharacterized protein n=1 Tax=Cacopsylla melanoneura TaxID=428564 RepID=A0A8D8Z7E7_9HEMI